MMACGGEEVGIPIPRHYALGQVFQLSSFLNLSDLVNTCFPYIAILNCLSIVGTLLGRREQCIEIRN
jgi:hypothetical protein